MIRCPNVSAFAVHNEDTRSTLTDLASRPQSLPAGHRPLCRSVNGPQSLRLPPDRPELPTSGCVCEITDVSRSCAAFHRSPIPGLTDVPPCDRSARSLSHFLRPHALPSRPKPKSLVTFEWARSLLFTVRLHAGKATLSLSSVPIRGLVTEGFDHGLRPTNLASANTPIFGKKSAPKSGPGKKLW